MFIRTMINPMHSFNTREFADPESYLAPTLQEWLKDGTIKNVSYTTKRGSTYTWTWETE